MNNTNESKKTFIVPVICAIVCVVIIAVAVGFALSGGERSDNGTTEAASQPVTETEASGTEPFTEPIENAIQQNDNYADDIFAP